tara:strand:+ start:3841 stop:4698 length:858 start_codon:yes stop_codon:yes gene_type:complete
MRSIGNFESYQNCFSVSLDQSSTTPKKGGGKREEIKGLSKGSRRRLVHLINSFGPVNQAFFVTLTMREASEDFKEWKKWLNRTLTAMRYMFPKLSGIWRLEFQKRGTPHFHLLLFTQELTDIKVLRAKIKSYWRSAVGNKNSSSFHSCKVEQVRDVKKSGFYLAIYQAKNEQDRTDIPTGKTYGIINKKDLPIARYEGGEFEDLYFNVWAKRIYRRYIIANGASKNSPLLFNLRTRTSGFRGFLSRQSQKKLFSLVADLTNQKIKSIDDFSFTTNRRNSRELCKL